MTNLTAEQLQQILKLSPGQYGTNIGGTFYQPVYSSNAQGEAGMGQEGGLQQILGYDPTKTDVGQQYSMYGGGGDYQGQGAFKKVKDGDLMAMGLLSAFGMGMLPGAMAGGASVGAEGLGTLGSLSGEAGFGSLGLDSLGMGGIGAEAGGIFGGGLPGAFSGLGAEGLGFAGFSPEFAAAGLGGTLGGGAGGAAGAAFNAAKDSQLANAGIAAAGGDPSLGYAAAGAGGVTGSPVGGLAGLLGKYGGLATTALGGLLGSKGQQEEATKTSKIDPRLDPYIYGDQGILKQVNDLKNQQLAQGGLNDLQRQGMSMTQNFLMDPALSAGYTSMRNAGSGLLGRGVAANPFAK